MRVLIPLLAAFMQCLDPGASAGQPAVGASADVPAWVYPFGAPPPLGPAAYDRVTPIHIPNSTVAFTEAQLNDLFSAPDWHPESHSPMPDVVSHGRPPDVYACGFCHTPSGQGRPENASLAGLPAPYIVQQVADFKSGARHRAWPDPYRPSDLMSGVAAHATGEEVAVAAEYFARQTLRPRVTVVESATVPKTHVVGWVYVADDGKAREALGERLLELAPDARAHESRVDDVRYIAYVPPGSLKRGSAIAHSDAGASATPCASCHGEALRGVGVIPPLAGRSPTYLLRQLLAFKTGARSGANGLPMKAVAAALAIDRMIDVTAYAASLPP